MTCALYPKNKWKKMTIYDVLGDMPTIYWYTTNNSINNIQTYYPNHSPLIKIYNFKTIQLCPKTVINQHTPLDNFNTPLKLNTQIGSWYKLNNKSFKKIKNGYKNN